MYSTHAPRNWADLRSEQHTVITCVDPSYRSAVGVPRPQGIIHWLHVVVEYGVSVSIMGGGTAKVKDIPYPSYNGILSSVSCLVNRVHCTSGGC